MMCAYPLGWYMNRVRLGLPFAFSRYGDGEWACIRGKRGVNCDGNRYTPELRSLLIQSIEDAPPDADGYHTAMQGMAMRLWGPKIERWLREHGVERPWHDADVFHRVNRAGELSPFVRLLNERRSVLVGPEYLHEVPVDFNRCIRTPRKNATEQYAGIVRQVAAVSPRTVVCLALGPVTGPVINAVWRAQPGRCWLVDVGSVFDPYVAGGRQRLYFSRLTPDARARNLA